MKTIIANILRGWGKTPCYLLAAFFALAATGAWAATNITDNVTLTEDTDWSGEGVVTIAEGVTLDLNGYALKVAAINGAGGIIDSLAGYERRQYLQSTAEYQFVNTGYVHKDDTKVDIRVSFDTVAKTWQCIYGARSAANAKTRFSAWLSNDKFRRELGAAGQNIASPAAEAGVVYDIHLDKTGSFTVTPEDGETFSKNADSGDNTSSGGALAAGQTDFLFGIHEKESNKNYWTSNHWAFAKLYSCKIYTGETLERDFVPVRRVSDGKPGLFDLANKVFYGNGGAGEFNTGATVSEGGLQVAFSGGGETPDFSALNIGPGVSLVFAGADALPGDLDATAFASVKVASGAVLDLAGHNLTATAVTGEGTITDTAGTAISGYERLEYIQSTGAQYIDTGYVHDDTTKVDMRIQIDSIGGWQGFYGARYYSGGEADRFSVWVHTDKKCFCSEQGTSRQDHTDYTVDTSKIYDIHLAKKGEESTVSVDGDQVVSLGTGTATGGSFDEGRSDYLFALHQYYDKHDPKWYANFHTKAKLYSCRIYSGETLERDFVPVKRGDDIGLLDLANGKFYANAGAGTFTAGPVVATTSGGELRIEVAEGETLSLADMVKITGTVKVVKTGSGKLNLNWTTYNEGGFDVDEGTLSFGGDNTKITSGTLTVKSGATLEKQTGNNPDWLAPSVVFKDGAKLNIPYSGGSVGAVSANAITLEGALEVSFSATPAAGAYPLLTILGEGTFDASALEGITLPDDPAFAGAVLSLPADAKSVVLILSSDPVWIGGTSGDLGVASNWSNGVVPQAGTNAVITAAAAAFLTNSAAFTAKSITFFAGCPKVTIEGAPLTGIEAINNLSSANHEFTAAVVADALTISNTTTYCVFTGGLTANSVSFAETGNDKCSIYGVWHIKDNWTPVSGNSLYAGASVTVDGTLVNPNNLVIYEGCVVTAATLRATGSCQHLTYYNAGRLVVKELCEIATTGDSYLTRNGQGATATVEFGGYRDSASDGWQRINAKNVIVGADGIENNRNVHFRESAILHPRTSGFEFKGSGKYYTTDDGVTIDTTQYETELPATIEINSVFAYFASGNIGKMAVIGCGKVVFKSVSTFTGGLTVSDTATVAVNPGMRPGNGTVTVRNGATLQVAQSGTVALGGDLALKAGATLGFNFTEKRTVPVLDVTGKTVTLNGSVVVKISATEGIRPKGGATELTSGGKFTGATVSLAAGAPSWVKDVEVKNGEIVLDVKPYGAMILVK